jgi:hypothetical protein
VDKILAIYDSDALYTTRFAEFVNKRTDFYFEVTAFTKRDLFNEFIRLHKIELLLISEDISFEESWKDQIRYVYLISDSPVREKSLNPLKVFKYQSV